jgi:hypothetical protein
LLLGRFSAATAALHRIGATAVAAAAATQSAVQGRAVIASRGGRRSDREKKSLFFSVEIQIDYLGDFDSFWMGVLGGSQFARLVAVSNSFDRRDMEFCSIY